MPHSQPPVSTDRRAVDTTTAADAPGDPNGRATLVEVHAAVVGWFMVLRRQSFAGHTLAVVGFPGAAAAVWLGIDVSYGYVAVCVGAALVIAALPQRNNRGYTGESGGVPIRSPFNRGRPAFRWVPASGGTAPRGGTAGSSRSRWRAGPAGGGWWLSTG